MCKTSDRLQKEITQNLRLLLTIWFSDVPVAIFVVARLSSLNYLQLKSFIDPFSYGYADNEFSLLRLCKGFVITMAILPVSLSAYNSVNVQNNLFRFCCVLPILRVVVMFWRHYLETANGKIISVCTTSSK